MGDKQDRYFVITVAIAILIYVLSRPKNVATSDNAQTAPDSFINDPVQSAYNPGFGFQPTPMSQPDINVSVANQGLSYLNSNYIPLFGFIGMAQGETFH